MRPKLCYFCWNYLICVFLLRTGVNSTTTQTSEDSDGSATVTSQTVSNNQNDWLPRLNVTCINEELSLLNNPSCVENKVNQTKKVCSPGIYKSSSSYRSCVVSLREINCSTNQVCDLWSWQRLSDCCQNDSCEFYGYSVGYEQAVWNRTRNCRHDIDASCTKEIRIDRCQSGRKGKDRNSGTSVSKSAGSATKVIAFSLSAFVMVGLLLFAGLKLRRAAIKRQRATPYDRNDQEGIDNEIGPLAPDSRIQTILNTINSNGRSFEVRERSDSIPGRRVYVLSPTPEDPNANRGRIFSRATSQLSSIAEEDTEDALSHITEGTEPLDESDNVFRYDSDAINEVDLTSSPVISNGCAVKPASSTEALDCINDVIAMYDVDNDDTENDNIEAILRQTSTRSNTDFRVSETGVKDDYLQNFGWKPQERSWKLEKLKDEKSNEKLYASCSTLDSKYSEKSLQSSQYSLTSSASVANPLLSNGDVTNITLSTNLRKEYRSLPSLLDTSQIPDIEEVLGNNDVEYFDVIENGDVRV